MTSAPPPGSPVASIDGDTRTRTKLNLPFEIAAAEHRYQSQQRRRRINERERRRLRELQNFNRQMTKTIIHESPSDDQQCQIYPSSW